MYSVKVYALKLNIVAPTGKVNAFLSGDCMPSRAREQSAGGATKGNTAFPRLLSAQLCQPQGGESFKYDKFIQTKRLWELFSKRDFLATSKPLKSPCLSESYPGSDGIGECRPPCIKEGST